MIGCYPWQQQFDWHSTFLSSLYKRSKIEHKIRTPKAGPKPPGSYKKKGIRYLVFLHFVPQ